MIAPSYELGLKEFPDGIPFFFIKIETQSLQEMNAV